MSRNLFFSTWFTCSIHINKKYIYQNGAAQRNLLLNSPSLKNLEDESDAF